MADMPAICLSNQTMSSRDIAELTGKEHSHVLRDIRAMISMLYPNMDAAEIKGIIISKREDNGQMSEICLPKREALILTSGYSITQRAAIIDRWQELEVTQPAVLPSYPEALRALASSLEQVVQQQAIIAQQAPAVAFVERYVESSGNKGLREVCKLLKANESQFKAFLTEGKIMYRLGGRLMPTAQHLDAKRFEICAGIGENEHAFTAAKFTPKGINWIAGLWAVHNLGN